MSWSATTLSTSETIARHEKEINIQAGSTARKAIYVAAGLNVWLPSDEFATCTYAILTYSDGSTATVNVAADKIALPTAKYITGIDLYDVSDDLLFSFPVNEGYGATLYDSTGAKTLTLTDSSGSYGGGWTETSTSGDYSWQEKIDLAKEMLGNDITTKLKEYGLTVDYEDGEVLIDLLTNPETFLVACDYLTLSLIYQDLLSGGFNELFVQKYQIYSQRYQDELAKGLKRMDIASTPSGTTTDYQIEIMGRLSR
ncbi:MAG TPA: hypothetical protein PLG04_02555 [Anaerolineaceae bacterium]|nr:hypothetical protein [Anaerolineaceae bacterium]